MMGKPKKYCRAMTYAPKVEGVRRGLIRQTIRPRLEDDDTTKRQRIQPGSVIQFHGWEGLPYRSKWSWRMNVVVTEIIPISVIEQGMIFSKDFLVFCDNFVPWRNPIADNFALMDGIYPATGVELGRVLRSMYDLRDPLRMNIIRWDFVKCPKCSGQMTTDTPLDSESYTFRCMCGHHGEIPVEEIETRPVVNYLKV